MKNIKLGWRFAMPILFLCFLPKIVGQNQSQASDFGCFPATSGTIIPGKPFFNYGNSNKMKTSTRRMKLTIGQTVIGFAPGDDYNGLFGFWSGLNVSPLPPVVTATQGELLDRIQISWALDPLGAFPVNGFKIYRDGFFLAAVDKNTRTYLDFNVIAGKNYKYEVRGVNLYGEGSGGEALGFQVPNGVATGWVRTLNGNAVPNAQITLSPMQGFSAKFNQFDGATARAGAGNNFFPTAAATDWTLTFWMKTTAVLTQIGTADILRGSGLAVRTNTTGGIAFVVPGVTNGTEDVLWAIPAGGNDGSWHNLALTFSGGQYRLYLDGNLADLKSGSPSLTSQDLNFGKNTSFTGWEGALDELRIYHRRLDELDLTEVLTGTASTLTPNLKYYWKMDEGAGSKSFDILNRHPLFFCGAIFDSNRSPVATSGVTNSDGYYRIEGANYGTGTTFLATPKKDFYKHRALKFLKNEGDHATLPDFGLTEKSTLELWVNQSEPNNANGNEVFLHKSWGAGGSQFFFLQNIGNTLQVNLNGSTYQFGALGLGYRHLAVTIQRTPTNTLISVYNNGVLAGSVAAVPTTGDWSEPGYSWNLGALSGLYGVQAGQFGYFFGGLIDELAVYDTTLSQTKIAEHVQNSRDAQEKGLRIYFALDEGGGLNLSNAGSALVDGFGLLPATTGKPEWTTFSKFQETTPHVFTPATRQVTLNPSVTSVDQVDFVDRSTVAVSGFVRYANTDCFANQVEILVNGEVYSPAILTDSTGKFVIDLEPGASVVLKPRFKNHEFFPEEISVSNVIAPLAGLVFNDITTRKISGQVAGGTCKKSILQNPGTPTGTKCTVTVRTTNGCFEKKYNFGLNQQAGNYILEGLPPLELTIAVTEHSDPAIKTAFQVQGGSVVDLTEKQDTVVGFTYFAPPEVQIVSGLEPVNQTCDIVKLIQNENRTIVIKVKETYYNNEVCHLDSADLQIINGFSDTVVVTRMKGGTKNYTFRVGKPNPTPPHEKTIQIVATTQGNESSFVKQGVVVGTFNKHSTFTSKSPQTPLLVLHDPPGDGSYSFLEKEQTVCNSTTMEFEFEKGFGAGLDVWLGPEISVSVGLGVEYVSTTGVILSGGFDGQVTFNQMDSKTYQTCTTFSERISTGDNQLIVGTEQGGDVFVGQAMNLEFGFADLVSVNDTTCTAIVKSVLNVQPDTFQTTFYYSEWGIQENVIRFLDSLRTNPGTPPGDTLSYANSIKQWKRILSDNQKQKDSIAIYSKNISFDAGATYEYAVTTAVDTTVSSGSQINSEGETYVNLGFQFNKVGLQGTAKFLYSTSKTKSTETNESVSTKTGYVLADDDILDAFTIDVGTDKRYGTPIFKTKAGQSSCPWEPKTAHREGNTMEFRDGSGPDAIDVPSNEPAVFLMTLGNKSETNETFTYAFTAGPESNAHGAKISVNGIPLDVPIFYAIPWDPLTGSTSVPITVTVERGPIEYDYDSLEIVFYSLCEDQRANALGILPDDDKILYSAQYISAHFIRPCSEVNINVPEENWAITAATGNDIFPITVSGYDKSNADFEKIRVQYRRTDGDGAWINVPKPSSGGNPDQDATAAILRDNLGANYTQFYWDTDGLADGDYEIHAWAICTGDAADKPGFSKIIKGKIQRQPPSLIGLPQPSDGVYQVGDEISFKFNKDINCQKINALDNVLLFDATTDLPINIDISCKDNQIFLDPRFDNNSFFENRILRAELRDIEDLVGNNAENPVQDAFPSMVGWEFYVDRNELAWLTDSLGMTKFDDETKITTAKIHNRGGYPAPFEILEVPSWVRVVPNSGTLAPNEIREIRFEVDSVLPFGHWFDTIVLRTITGQNPFFMGGDEGLPFGVRVVCRPPDWDFDPQNFTNSMNMVLKLKVQGTFSNDPEDMVVAWLNNKVVGRSHLEFVPQTGEFLAFLTVYGEAAQQNAPLKLEIWDASACLRFGILQSNFTFQPDNVVGSPTAPQVIETSNFVLRDVPIGAGWNWLSFNLAFPNPSLNASLASLHRPANDLMKSQTQFSTYSVVNGVAGWYGSLATLVNPKMYIFKADLPDTLKMEGTVLNPATTPISVDSGWTWIGYIPKYPLPINVALSSLNPTAGNLIKSQTEFAQFISPTFGWVGNLKFMQAPRGYQIKLTSPGTITYPPQPQNKPADGGRLTADGAASERGGNPTTSFWNVDPTKFEHSTTLIGMLKIGDLNATVSTMELGVFVGGEIRGTAQAIFIEPSQSYLFFMTAYSNAVGEKLEFKLFDSATGNIQDLSETMNFTANLHQGSIENPVPFSPKSTATGEQILTQSFDIQPNPFKIETVFKFALPQSQEVILSVVNLNGQTISEERFWATEGLNLNKWTAENKLENGVYFVRLETTAGTIVRKMILQK